MATDDTTDPTASGDTSANSDSNGSATATKPAAIYTKDEHTAAIKREVGKVLAEKAQLEQRLAALDEEKRTAEEAKLSATQRAELERKREREALTAQLDAARAEAGRERTLRHDTLRSGRAASLASSIAAQLANPGLLPHVEAVIAQRLVIEPVEGGGERVVIQLGAPGDVEPLESGFAKFRDEHLAPFFKVATGSGALHGAGAKGVGASIAHLSPTDKIRVGMEARLARR